MSPRVQPFSQVIEQERRRWMSCKRALSIKDQAVFDWMFACATQQLQTEVPARRPWTFEAVLMAVLLEYENWVEEMVRRLEELTAGKYMIGVWNWAVKRYFGS